MTDTFIANATIDDLRAVVRGTLAASPPSIAAKFTDTARQRLLQSKATPEPVQTELFTQRSDDGAIAPTEELTHILSRIRASYGAGLGFESLRDLAIVVRCTRGIQWDEGSELEYTLASIDADISQAIQSSREEMDGGRVTDLSEARGAVNELRAAVKECRRVAESGAGGYPFEQGAIALEFWKI
ncbi:hypothetical protein WOLCODRAFT_102624 [Wolfiporia cocos MD-104 SS10]|uniref:Uncharacterized protein n=1 Tax=Wolfiporia cocos (strain MD-104) TaxID=742152 RepID=A0A2H3JV68_WOLCO|nr:hypothetical protein WOLCODRAFT_102624 [Wolfiporia cocos MD-104 SS10]